MTPRRAIWSELVPYDTLLRPEVRKLLNDRDLGVHVAVTPGQLDGLPRVVATLKDDGRFVAVWPMIEHEHGRWPSVHNAARFDAFVAEVLTRLGDHRPDAIALDFEPPIQELPGLLRLEREALVGRWRRRGLAARATAHFAGLVTELSAHGLATIAVTFPLPLEDDPRAGWQRFFGTPLDGLRCEQMNTMLYTSMLEGYAQGGLRRLDVRGLLSWWSHQARRRFGERAGVSVGCVGRGILGDEPTYRHPQELADDVAIVQAAGIDRLVLFSLGGALTRAPAERWLDALVHTPPGDEVVALTRRARLLVGATRAGARGLGWVGALRTAARRE